MNKYKIGSFYGLVKKQPQLLEFGVVGSVFFFPVKIKSARENVFGPFFGFFHGHFSFFTPTFWPIFHFFHAHFFFFTGTFLIFLRFFHGEKIYFHVHKIGIFHGQLFFFTGKIHHGILVCPVSSVRAVR